jgi:hypothetical protein
MLFRTIPKHPLSSSTSEDNRVPSKKKKNLKIIERLKLFLIFAMEERAQLLQYANLSLFSMQILAVNR